MSSVQKQHKAEVKHCVKDNSVVLSRDVNITLSVHITECVPAQMLCGSTNSRGILVQIQDFWR